MPTGLTFQTTPTSGYNGLDEAYTSTCSPPTSQPSLRSRPPRGESPAPRSDFYWGRERISDERSRQRHTLNYNSAHDSRYVNGELVQAAKAYEFGRADLWPWAPESFKPRGEIENLTRAGALWMAERDRARPDCGSEEAEALASHDCDIELNRIARKIQFLLDAADEDRRIRSRVSSDYCGEEVTEPPCDTVSEEVVLAGSLSAQAGEQPSMGHWTGGTTPATTGFHYTRHQESAGTNPCHDQVRVTATANTGWSTVGTVAVNAATVDDMQPF